MGIKSSKTLTRDRVLERMDYILYVLEGGLYDDALEDKINGMLEEVMDTDLFRFSEFENYRVVKSLEDLEE